MAQENGCLVACNMSHSGCYQEISFLEFNFGTGKCVPC